MRSGFVAIVGQPNVGKSTLLNHVLGVRIAAVSSKPQTTRNRIVGVKNVEGAQLVFVDTPGVHRPHGALSRYMVDQAMAALDEVDAVLLVVEAPARARARASAAAARPPRLEEGERLLLEKLGERRRPTALAINKVDRVRDKVSLLPLLDAWSKRFAFDAIVPISAASGDGVARLLGALAALLPEGPALFPEEMITDAAERFLAAELVREQVFQLTHQEVPYASAVTIDAYEERSERKDVVIEATVHVERESQRAIVVGEGGKMIKEIGTRARAGIGALLGCPVHLKLWVKVEAGWSQDPRGLRKLGYE